MTNMTDVMPSLTSCLCGRPPTRSSAMWPFETSKVGTALINLLQTYPPQQTAGRHTFDDFIRRYARAHTRTTADGGLPPPHVDEDLHPDDGYWITRRKMHGVPPWPGTGGIGRPRGADPLAARGDHYFHSTFNDLVLSGLVGVRPRDAHLELHPLSLVAHFSVTRLRVRALELAVVWDAIGEHYPHGAGLHVWIDGRWAASALPQNTSGRPLPPRLQIAWDGSRVAACSGPPADGAASTSTAEGCRDVSVSTVPAHAIRRTLSANIRTACCRVPFVRVCRLCVSEDVA